MMKKPAEVNIWKFLGINRVILALSVVRMGDGIANSILFVMIPLYAAKLPDTFFDLPLPLVVGILISVYGLSAASLQPFMAAVVDRIGHHKRFILGGLILICLATVSFIAADRYLDLLGLRILQGCGLAMEIPPAMALIAIMTRTETRGAAMGFYSTLRMAGLAIGPLLGGFLHDHFGFNAAFIAGAGILLGAMIILQLWVKDITPIDAPAVEGRFRIFDFSLITPSIASAGLATFLMASVFTLITTLENEFNRRLGIHAFGFGLAFSALMIGRLLLQVPMGKFSDYLGRKPFIFFGLLALAPATALLGEVTSLFQFVSLRFIQGIAAAAIIAPALALAGDESKAGGQSRQMTIVTMGFGWGIAFGPLMSGILSIVSFSLPFRVTAVLCLVGAWVVHRYMTETVVRKNRGHARQ